jgi:hypothetical protein
MARTYEPIAQQTLSGAAASVTFSSIAATWQDLVVTYSLSESTGNVRSLFLRFNADSGTNYSGTYLYGSGSAAGSGRLSSEAYIRLGRYHNINGNLIGAGHLMSYSSTSVFKTVLNVVANQSDTSNPGVSREVGLWRSTAAVTSVEFIAGSPAQFAIGSTFALYGIKAA